MDAFEGSIAALDSGLFLRYLFVFFMLILMEGLLSADNALVLAVMVRPLPPKERGHALFYGLAGAFILRFTALFLVSYLAGIWQAQAIGAAYLIYVGGKNLYHYYTEDRKEKGRSAPVLDDAHPMQERHVSRAEFWLTVAKVELTDIAFAIDSILAAVALAMSLPDTGIGHIGGLDTGKFIVVIFGGFVGILIMRFAATLFVRLLDTHPTLEAAAFLLVLWVGVKLVVVTLAHPGLGILAPTFPESPLWQFIFFGTMTAIVVWGWLTSTDSTIKKP